MNDENEIPVKRKVGRPTLYCDELADKFFSRLQRGRSVMDICEDEDMPCQDSFYKWLRLHKEFTEKYEQAIRDRINYQNEEQIDLEKRVLRGEIDAKAFQAVTTSKQWRAERMHPKKYGQRQHVDMSANVNSKIQNIDLSQMSEEELLEWAQRGNEG